MNFVPGEGLCKLFFPGEGPCKVFFFWRRPFQFFFSLEETLLNFFFPGEGPPKFFFSISPRPQIINSCPLKQHLKHSCDCKGCPFSGDNFKCLFTHLISKYHACFILGSKHAYSNLGYEILGRVIERVTRMKYESYVKELLTEVGITRMQLGRTRKEHTEADEVCN